MNGNEEHEELMKWRKLDKALDEWFNYRLPNSFTPDFIDSFKRVYTNLKNEIFNETVRTDD